MLIVRRNADLIINVAGLANRILSVKYRSMAVNKFADMPLYARPLRWVDGGVVSLADE